jgi:hypothetical protein
MIAPMRRVAVLLLVLVVAAGGLSACQPTSTLRRPAAPVVLTGAKLPTLLGVHPSRIVAFRYDQVDGRGRWAQIPVQVDQRKVVPFGLHPRKDNEPGVEGLVYGSGEPGPTALQYAHSSTWVGRDPDPNFDADDELVFMGFDAGGEAVGAPNPRGTMAGNVASVQVQDPRSPTEQGWVYLFRSDGSLAPGAGRDYVDYDFVLAAGGTYREAYQRADGPNPELSKVRTSSYEVAFTDRWKDTSWRVLAPGATGANLVDAPKNQFATTTCGRSNDTFAKAEGAFVANIDGPVRAIRSYVGANSGPLTQRTQLMYRDRIDTVTDLRVHNVPGIMDFIDYGPGAESMTYRSSNTPDGVVIDGVDDAVPAGPAPRWESVDGPQGRIYTKVMLTTSQPGLAATATHFYRDQRTPTDEQCWGDGSYLGASGVQVANRIENSDPRVSPAITFRGVRITQFLPPAPDPSKIPAYADDWARDLERPLVATVSRYRP